MLMFKIFLLPLNCNKMSFHYNCKPTISSTCSFFFTIWFTESSLGAAALVSSPPDYPTGSTSPVAAEEDGAGAVGGAGIHGYSQSPDRSSRGRSNDKDKRVLLQLLDSHSGSEEREWAIKVSSEFISCLCHSTPGLLCSDVIILACIDIRRDSVKETEPYLHGVNKKYKNRGSFSNSNFIPSAHVG